MREYTGPTATEIAAALEGSREESSGGWRLRGFCHGSGEKRSSASLVVSDRPGGGLLVHCFVGCDRKTVITALEQESGQAIWDAWRGAGPSFRTTGGTWKGRGTSSGRGGSSSPPARPQTVRNGSSRRGVDMLAIARSTWDKTRPIPNDPDHPARRWLGNRNLWRPDFPLPGAVRWLPAAEHYQGRGSHTGAGSLVVLAAPPKAWTDAWPALPDPIAVHLIAIGHDGSSALDRPSENGGLGKRSVGSTAGLIVVFGNPVLSDATSAVRGAEGVADALALASRSTGPALATLGTSGMADEKDGNFVVWLATSPVGTVIHADADAAGEHAARQLRRKLAALDGGHVSAVLPARGNDAAEAAAAIPFAALPQGWEDYAKTLTETTNWPRWEIARQASSMPSEVKNDG